MNSFFNSDELDQIGFKTIGKNVKISKNACFYGANQIEIGSNVRIDDFCIISGNVKIGSYVHIGAGSFLYGSYGIEIGDFSGLSPKCVIYSSIDDFSGEYLISPLTKKKHNNLIKGKVNLGSYVQLGSNTIVFPDLSIPEGVATGARTLVRESVEPWFIYIGQECRKLKPRKKDLLKLARKYE